MSRRPHSLRTPSHRPRGGPLALASLVAVALVALGLAPTTSAWTPKSQQLIALDAARLAPPDLYRQLSRNRAAYLQGVLDPFRDGAADLHVQNPDGGGRLEAAILQSIDNAVLSIELLRPFNEIAYRVGVVSHYLADANNPLNCSEADTAEPRYFADFLHYMESADPRVQVVFYGFHPRLEGRRALEGLLDETFRRSRGLYPKVGREYRRIGFGNGIQGFDDRSTAFAVTALARSHAVSDIAEVLRYIWLEAGGIDTRPKVPLRGQNVVQIERKTRNR